MFSRNSDETNRPVIESLAAHSLDISMARLTGGQRTSTLLPEFDIDLFLSTYPDDVQAAIDMGLAAAKIYGKSGINPFGHFEDQIRIAYEC